METGLTIWEAAGLTYVIIRLIGTRHTEGTCTETLPCVGLSCGDDPRPEKGQSKGYDESLEQHVGSK